MRTRRSRETGYLVTVAKAEDFGLMATEGKWVTVCEEHGTDCHHETRRLAELWAAEPTMWCELCQKAGAK